jgi:hypothetical protein
MNARPAACPRLCLILRFCLCLCGCWPDSTLSDERRGRGPAGMAAATGGAKAARGGGGGPGGAAADQIDAAGPVDDGRPARWGPVTLTLVVDCVRVEVTASRPVTARASVTVDPASPAQEFALGEGATLFDVAFRVIGPAGAPAALRLLARDSAGLDLPSNPIDFVLPAAAGSLVITEVLANPAGPETQQEYVELANLGGDDVTTAGLRIEDTAGVDALPEALIRAGARVLIVGASFAEQSASDVPPRAGTALLRVAGRIGRDGLGQAGEIVRLVGPDGLVRSSYGGWIDTRRPAWAGQSVHRSPEEGGCDHPAAWSATPLAATPGW